MSSTTITQDIPRIQRIVRSLGIAAVAVYPGEHLGYGRHQIVIDWNGEEEVYDDPELAIKALYAAAER